MYGMLYFFRLVSCKMNCSRFEVVTSCGQDGRQYVSKLTEALGAIMEVRNGYTIPSECSFEKFTAEKPDSAK